MTANRRQFSRILFRSEARLAVAGTEVPVQLADLSLKGALIHPGADLFVEIGSPCVLTIRLGEPAATIRLEATVVHREGGHLGLACREIDLDSMTHLRRLVELNLGDEQLLNRELSALTSSE